MTRISLTALDVVMLSTASPSYSFAQDVVLSTIATRDCLIEAPSGELTACIGASTVACIMDSPRGDTTAGVKACVDVELQYLDGRLNVAYKDLRSHFGKIDAANTADGLTLPSLKDALVDMECKWILFRDGTCTFERIPFAGGTIASTIGLGCLLDETGRQALRIEGELTCAY
jgi:uncharacterized protein YecT (DUF1311 family)